MDPSAKPFVPNAAAPAFVPSFATAPAGAETAAPKAAHKVISIGAATSAKKEEKKKEEPEKKKEEPEKWDEAFTDDSALNDTGADSKEIEKLSEKVDVTKLVSEEKAVETTKIELDDDGEEEIEDEEPADGEPKTLKKNVNVVFIGHVDAGKSTISGHILYLTGGVDERTLEKYEREAKAKNRESWKYAWALDTTDQERAKGKTEECGRANFETENKRFTILDAPGHKNFIPHMIGGAAQADIGVLVISARKGEFETGFDRGGQTREHAMLAKTAGVRNLVVVINKMDDPTVEWAKERYDECVNKLTPFLKSVGYNPKTDVTFMPVSGLTGLNMKEVVDKKICPWWTGDCLLNHLDVLQPPERLFNAALRMPINDKYKEMGAVVTGKLESGTIKKNNTLIMMPNKVAVEVQNIYIDTFEINEAVPGDNVKLRLKNVEEEDIRSGFVLCHKNNLVNFVRVFDVQIVFMELKSIICAGFSCMMHIHSCLEEVTIAELLATLDKKTKEIIKKRPKFVRSGETVFARMVVQQPICVETFKEFPQLGRFMLRNEGVTLGVGVVKKLHDNSKIPANIASSE